MRRNERSESSELMPLWARLVVVGMAVAVVELSASTGYVVLAFLGDAVGYEHAPVTAEPIDPVPLVTALCVRAALYVWVIVVLWRRIRPAMRSDPRTRTVVRVLLSACLPALLVNVFGLLTIDLLTSVAGFEPFQWLLKTAFLLNCVLFGLAVLVPPMTVWVPAWLDSR